MDLVPNFIMTLSAESNYRVCKRCVMDTTDPEIYFDPEGVCNHCTTAEHFLRVRLALYREGPFRLDRVIPQIKEQGKGRPYDCVIGVSGGVDSTYVAYVARKQGLRCLAVHFDNGWNSELAVQNIENTLKHLDIDLHTHVMDWEVFRDLQLAFLKASVPDLEVPTDHAIAAVLYQTALKHGIRYILTGTNLATESILPRSWAYGHLDWRYIKGLHNTFGTTRLRGFPHFNAAQYGWYFGVRRLRTVSILNSVPYNKAEALELLTKELDWRKYGGKHHESIITRFLQGYILPKKFNIDKRKAHLSSLIAAGQITRADAMEELSKPPYDKALMAEDVIFVSKKFGLKEREFGKLMELPPKSFRDYSNGLALIERLKKVRNLLQKCHFLPRQVGM
jgi:N-acetyl sugar amidotransferase